MRSTNSRARKAESTAAARNNAGKFGGLLQKRDVPDLVEIRVQQLTNYWVGKIDNALRHAASNGKYEDSVMRVPVTVDLSVEVVDRVSRKVEAAGWGVKFVRHTKGIVPTEGDFQGFEVS